MKKLTCYMIIISSILFIHSANAQMVMKRLEVDGEIFIIPELSVIIAEEEDKVIVQMALPTEARPADYKNIEITQNDIILMMNAKKVKSVKSFKEQYEALEIGANIKIGIKRNEKMLILEYAKVDPAKMPKNTKMVIKRPGDGDEESHEGGVMKKMIINKDDDSIMPLPEAGLFLEEVDNQVKVMDTLPTMVDVFGEIEVKKGDSIVAVNGQKVVSISEFSKVYKKIVIGSKVEFTFQRDDKEFKAVVEKKEFQGKFMINN